MEQKLQLHPKTFMGFPIKKVTTIGVIVFIIIFSAIFIPKLFETVDKGTYQIKQTAVFGNMYAKMDPGMWPQLFGDIDEWPKAETFFFTLDFDTKGDIAEDTSIKVRFNDGSLCNISGTARILLPTTKTDAIALVTERGHKTYRDVQNKLIKPTVRKVLRHTANLMSATQSYSNRRGQYVQWAKDQIENGLYQTTTKLEHVKDLVSGEMIWKEVTVIKTDTGKVTGKPLYEINPLEGSGIGIKNFEVKNFDYEDKVKDQIAEQQQARMAVNTAKAKAQEAEQDKLTIEAQGKARVAKAEYAELELKAVAIVQSERDKEIALIKSNKEKEMAEISKDKALIIANQKKEVAALDAKAASEEKKANILRGQGESERKKLVMKADGALAQKLAAYIQVQEIYAREFGKHKLVPEITFGSPGTSTGSSTPATDLINMLSVKTAKEMGLDVKIKNQNQ